MLKQWDVMDVKEPTQPKAYVRPPDMLYTLTCPLTREPIGLEV